MSQSVIPVAKQIFICDDVVVDPTSRKPHVVNLWDTTRPTGPFPWRLPKLGVFACFRGGLGRVSSHVDIVEARYGDIVRRTRDYPLLFVNRIQTL